MTKIIREVKERVLQTVMSVSPEEAFAIKEFEKEFELLISKIPYEVACAWEDGACRGMREEKTSYNCCSADKGSQCKNQTAIGCSAKKKSLLCRTFLCAKAKKALGHIDPEAYVAHEAIMNNIKQRDLRGPMLLQWEKNQVLNLRH